MKRIHFEPLAEREAEAAALFYESREHPEVAGGLGPATILSAQHGNPFRGRAPNPSEFRWLIPTGAVTLAGARTGRWSGHDVCSTERAELVVTRRCLELLEEHDFNHCEITPLSRSRAT